MQALFGEKGKAKSIRFAVCLLDLEMVKLELVWSDGLEMHFPPAILRLMVESFAHVRQLTMSGGGGRSH